MSTTNKEEKVDSKDDNDGDKEKEEEEQVDPNSMQPQQKLFYFAKQGDVAGIKEIAKVSEVNALDDIGSKYNPYPTMNTALHYAVESGSLESVQVLYNLQAKLDAKNKLKSTPLHIAASLGHSEIVKFLIEVKANIEAKNIVQNTALHCAVYAGHTETVKVILNNLDEPRDALLEPNGVGMGPAKYTAHDDMKALLRTYFPKRNKENNENGNENNDVEEEPPNNTEAKPGNPTDENTNDTQTNGDNYKD